MDATRPLVLTDDGDLLDDLLRLAAAAGCELERAPDAEAARRRWAAAPLVVLDENAAACCASAAMPRRGGVLVVCLGEPPPQVWRAAVAVGAEKVLALPAAEQWLVSAFADAQESPGPVAGRVLTVLGGRGGGGASVLASAVALASARRAQRTLLVDCDPLGGGLDLVLGVEDTDGMRWPELALTGGRVAASSLHAALPTTVVDGTPLTVLSCDREGAGPEPDAVATVVEAGRRAGETVVCDLPRHLPETALAALDRADLTILVVPAEVRACAAAGPVARMATERGAHLRLVVRGPAPGGLAVRDVANTLDVPLLSAMRPEPGLATALDRGRLPHRPRGPLARTAHKILSALDTAGTGGAR
ncbi:septum site-determining protein Ssd [Streptoalloteichus hindustanus]|uniref:Helicase/secretion neighborhood CpaE-like protein n=1 Tax=Streptoalloteichus hindustanus TaxID=2017 RepID=A0A1M4VWC4_STRHI|nr:septum site-determining protein Ssd [Streptoalloteichus hindustanus]SHE73022.1 helicase/secretion neighborhood CpaE-like protein [Streptoalloteichus hindustanus]